MHVNTQIINLNSHANILNMSCIFCILNLSCIFCFIIDCSKIQPAPSRLTSFSRQNSKVSEPSESDYSTESDREDHYDDDDQFVKPSHGKYSE